MEQTLNGTWSVLRHVNAKMNNPISVIVICYTLMAIAGMFFTYKSDQELMQKWDTCVAQQKVEGAPFEEFMKQCMN